MNLSIYLIDVWSIDMTQLTQLTINRKTGFSKVKSTS